MAKRSIAQKIITNYANRPIGFLISNEAFRRQIMKLVDKRVQAEIFGNKNFPLQMQKDKYHMVRSIMLTVENAVKNAKNAPQVRRSIAIFLIQSIFFRVNKQTKDFQKKFGMRPPGFLLISPGKFCNLKCSGCYASSSSQSTEKLDWEVLDRIVSEKTNLWGSYFTVISGGEPFLWKDKGRTILDLAKKHSSNYFLVYTNGTLIDKEMAEKLARVGNISPAISVEGFEMETDARRGQGIHKKIIAAMENLKDAGIPFGISVTATKKNADLVVSDEFVDYYFKKLGARYGWFFQLMPIGRADCLKLMVTPEQRVRMFRKTQSIMKDRGIFIADFWNSGCISSGCLSAGREGGFLYIEWNGNVTPCVFNPYSPVNINEIYEKGKTLNDVLDQPFFAAIRKWQKEYALARNKKEIGNLIAPCPIKDHYDVMQKLLAEHQPKPIDKAAQRAFEDSLYQEGLKRYGEDVMKATEEIWKKEYLES